MLLFSIQLIIPSAGIVCEIKSKISYATAKQLLEIKSL